MSEPRILSLEELEALFDAALHLDLDEPSRRNLVLTAFPPRIAKGLPRHTRTTDQLRSDLQDLNKLFLAEGQPPLLALWLEHSERLVHGAGDFRHVNVLRRMRSRLIGRKETLQVRYLAPPDRASWVAELPLALEHPDYTFEVHPFDGGEADLVLMFFWAELPSEIEEQANAFLKRFETTKRPPFLLLESQQPTPAARRREAGRIADLIEEAGKHVRVEPVEPETAFVGVIRRRLPDLVAELDDTERSGRLQRDRAHQMANARFLVKWSEDKVEETAQEVKRLFDAEAFEAAIRAIEPVEKKLLERPEDTPDWRRRLARLRLNKANCWMNLQKPEEAARILGQVTDEDVVELFEPDGQAIFARGLIWVDQLDRAERLIPPGSEGDLARQLLAVQRGQDPQEGADHIEVLTMAGQEALQAGRYGHAVRLGLRLIVKTDNLLLSQVLALQMLTNALTRTILEMDVVEPVPVEDRAAVVEAIEQTLERLEPIFRGTEGPHGHLKGTFEGARWNYRGISPWTTREDESAEAPGEGRASTAPWMSTLIKAKEQVSQGDFEGAISTLEAGAADWPDRVPLETMLAELYLHVDRDDDAERRARNAFRLLPVSLSRALLANALQSLERFEEAWTIIQPLAGHHRADARKLVARVAEEVPSLTLEEKLLHWKDYLDLRPGDVAARLRRAGLCERFGEPERARELAWEAVQDVRVSPFELHRVALMQMRAGDTNRLRMILDRLKAEFPGDGRVEHMRMEIWRYLGRPRGAGPDWQLLHQAGLLQVVPLEEAWAQMASYHDLKKHGAKAYELGYLSIEALAQTLDQSLALILATGMAGESPLSPTFRFAVSAWSPAEASELLVGADSLHILAATRGLRQLEELVLGQHTLVLFEDVEARIQREALEVPRRFFPEELRRLEAVRALLAAEGVVLHSDDQDDDVLAASLETSLLSWEGPLNPGAVAAALRDEGRAESEAEARLLREFADSEPAELPDRLVIGAEVLSHPQVAEWLLALLLRRPTVVHVSKDGQQAIRMAIKRQEFGRLAKERALQVAAFVGRVRAAGRLQVEPRPLAQVERWLPPARSGQAFGRGWIVADLAWREALAGHPSRWFLVSDYLPGAPLGLRPREMLAALAWDESSAGRAQEHFDEVEARLLTLGEWAAELDDGEDLQDGLIEVGLPAYFSERMVARLAARSRGRMDGRELNRLEQTARATPHPGRDTARLVLSHAYSEAIIGLWVDESSGWATAATHGLLDRLEGPLSEVPGLQSGQMGLFSLLTAVSDRSRSKRAEDLASCILSWVRAREEREALLTAALRQLWLLLDDGLASNPPDRRAQAQFGVLFNLFVRPRVPAAGPSGLPAVLVDLAILSGRWSVKPMESFLQTFRRGPSSESVDGEALLMRTAQHLAEGRKMLLDSGDLVVKAKLRLPGVRIADWFAPVEAVLLRVDVEHVADLAQAYADELASDDGRLSQAASDFGRSPAESENRSRLAHFAVESPARRVREHPHIFASWGREGFPRSLEDVRDLLSEPAFDATFDDLWHARMPTSMPQVLRIAEAPGRAPLVGAWIAVRDGVVADLWMEAEHRLTSPLEQPGARVGMWLAIARLITRGNRTLVVRGQDLDIRTRLRQRLPEVLRALMEAPPAGSVAAFEPHLLRLCFHIIHRFPDAMRASPAERMWLTWRLHGWLIAQCETLDSDAQRRAYDVLSRASERLDHSGRPDDAFDPRRFGFDRVDHRLILALYALLVGELMTESAEPSPEGYKPDSPELIDLLVQLAQRPLTEEEGEIARLSPPTVLDWSMPVTVPELALKVLLQLDTSAWLKLPESERIRWMIYFHSINGPRSAENLELLWRLGVLHRDSLGETERRLLLDWLLALSEPSAMAMLSLLTILVAGDDLPVPSDLDDRIGPHLSSGLGRFVFTLRLELALRRAPETFEGVARSMLSRANSPTELVLGLGYLASRPEREIWEPTKRLLQVLLSQSPYRDDSKVEEAFRESVPAELTIAMKPEGYLVLFALLARPDLMIEDHGAIATEAGVTAGDVLDVLRRLWDKKLLIRRGGRLKLRATQEIAEWWLFGYADVVRPARLLSRQDVHLSESPTPRLNLADASDISLADLAQRLSAGGQPWWWGGEAAAWLLLRHLRPDILSIHVEGSDLPKLEGPGDRRYPVEVMKLLCPAARGNDGSGSVHPLLVWSELMLSTEPRVHEVANEILSALPHMSKP